MKVIISLMLTLCVLMSFGLNAEPKLIRLEEALEETTLNITLDNSLNGYIVGKMCKDCKSIRVTITPETVAMEKRTVVPLIEAKKRAGKPAFVIFDPKTMKVNKIRW